MLMPMGAMVMVGMGVIGFVLVDELVVATGSSGSCLDLMARVIPLPDAS